MALLCSHAYEAALAPDGTLSTNQSAKTLAEYVVGSAPSVPEWYPDWARQLAELYFSGTTCLFILHGNVYDLLYCPQPGANERFSTLTEFLSTQMFGNWDLVVSYDLAAGLRPVPGPSPKRLHDMVSYLTARMGQRSGWPRDPDQSLSIVDQLVNRNLMEDAAETKQMAFLFPYAHYLMPAGDLAMLAGGKAQRLVQLYSWAQNPYIKRVNTAFCLIADNLTEINERLVESPHVATIEVPLPDESVRSAFLAERLGADVDNNLEDLTIDSLTQLSSGLDLTSLNVVISRSRQSGKRLGPKQFSRLKKVMIERQCRGLVDFLQPTHTLDMVVGHEAAIERLQQDGRWIEEGRLDAAPMGYLICGPVGTGKTFLAECFAGSIGIPCVALRNFRSKYVGETEANLERVLTVLRSLGPVAVIIDEADAALGNREASGDSGTSSRVFSMIASQMGNTRYRGRIIWMLLTSRPDLLPIDLKRQGRAEVHIPLFYPESAEELKTMFEIMARKNKIPLAPEAVPDVSPDRNLSGADIESIVLNARRDALAAHRDTVTPADLRQALDDFIPSSQGLEKERQELCAVLECTDMAFLPELWRTKVAAPNGRSLIQERAKAIQMIISD